MCALYIPEKMQERTKLLDFGQLQASSVIVENAPSMDFFLGTIHEYNRNQTHGFYLKKNNGNTMFGPEVTICNFNMQI